MKNFFVSCPHGMEDLLLREMDQFKLLNVKKSFAGLYFEGETSDVCSFLLATRFASRVYGEIKRFQVKREDEIVSNVRSVNWDDHLNTRESFKVNCNLKKDIGKSKYFKNTHYLSLLVKDGICDYFNDKENTRPFVDVKTPDHLFYLYAHMKSDFSVDCVLYQDLGGLLSNRGYRSEKFRAPLRENLAAAIIEHMDWKTDEPFLDLMCGSGTLVIEALFKKYKLPSQYFKMIMGEKFPLEKTKTFFVDLTEKKAEAKEYFNGLQNKGHIYAQDIHPESLEITKNHLRKLELEEFVDIKQHDATHCFAPENGGVVIANPPYGERMSDQAHVEKLYFDLGENLKKNFKGWTWYLFTGNPGLRKKVSLQTSKRIPLTNGDLECRLFEYKLY